LLIDRHKQKLIDELNESKGKRIKELETVKQEIEFHLAALQSFRKYSEELRDKGTACDVARAASGLHERAKYLMAFDIRSHVSKFSSVGVSVFFTPRVLESGDTKHDAGLIGVLNFKNVVVLQTPPPPPAGLFAF